MYLDLYTADTRVYLPSPHFPPYSAAAVRNLKASKNRISIIAHTFSNTAAEDGQVASIIQRRTDTSQDKDRCVW